MLKLLKLNLQFFSEDLPKDPPADPPAAPAPKTYDEDYVKDLRAEAAKYRTRAKEAETNAEVQQKEVLNKVFSALGINPDPNLEFEKQLTAAQLQAQTAEKRANERLIKAEIKAVGAELHIVDSEAAYLFADKEGFSVQEDGTVEGVKEALQKVIEAKPYLVAAPNQKQSGYVPGSNQNGNPSKPIDPYEAARERARKKLRK